MTVLNCRKCKWICASRNKEQVEKALNEHLRKHIK